MLVFAKGKKSSTFLCSLNPQSRFFSFCLGPSPHSSLCLSVCLSESLPPDPQVGLLQVTPRLHPSAPAQEAASHVPPGATRAQRSGDRPRPELEAAPESGLRGRKPDSQRPPEPERAAEGTEVAREDAGRGTEPHPGHGDRTAETLAAHPPGPGQKDTKDTGV